MASPRPNHEVRLCDSQLGTFRPLPHCWVENIRYVDPTGRTNGSGASAAKRGAGPPEPNTVALAGIGFMTVPADEAEETEAAEADTDTAAEIGAAAVVAAVAGWDVASRHRPVSRAVNTPAVRC